MIDQVPPPILLRLSHDLRSPLMVLIGSLDELAAEESASLRQQTAVLARRSVMRLRRMADRLLLWGRIGEGLRVSPRPVDVVPLVQAAVDQVRQSEPREKMVTQVVSSHSPLVAQTDPGLFVAMCAELFANAFQQGNRSAEAQISAVEVSFEDDGEGVAPDRADSIFSGGHSSGQGFGLPLALALAKALGGELRLEPSAKTGRLSRFAFRFQR